MREKDLRSRLIGITSLVTEYCLAVENAAEMSRNEFISKMLDLLPRIYVEFIDLIPHDEKIKKFYENENDDNFGEDAAYGSDDMMVIQDGIENEPEYFADYVDEDYYEGVRRHIETLLGPEDTFLDTFEEDMKYSDTPIAASISESLADIFQPLYNFISIVKDSDGEYMEGAYRDCHSNFVAYWSQTLCNVLRALNHIYFNS